MSREIKFRAWDKKESKMVLPSQEGFRGHEEESVAIQLNGDLVVESNEQYYPSICYRDIWGGDNGSYNEQLILMQFTGLKDKNGKEIYEGDIVEIDGNYTSEMDMPPNREVVEFIDGCFLPRPHGESFEIVGNIYQNPELLK